MFLDSLHIRGFRAFKDLRIPRLASVNLIAGLNGAGKSSLLEALRIYAAGLSAAEQLCQLLEYRQEGIIGRGQAVDPLHRESPEQFDPTRLFHTGGGGLVRAFEVGPLQRPAETLSVGLESRVVAEVELNDVEGDDKPNGRIAEPVLVLRCGGERRFERMSAFAVNPNVRSMASGMEGDGQGPKAAAHFLRSRALGATEIVRLWNRVVRRRDSEQEVVSALQIIAPDIEGVTVAQAPESYRTPDVLVARKGLTSRESLGSLGEGLTRLFSLALALAETRGGVLLVDEIENGLHHSVHEKLWRFMGTVARRLDIQVFATTHSWDCVQGLQAAELHDSALIRLDRNGDDIVATTFDEQEVAVAVRESIEIR
jgi:AAA domain, putative AbiEii toxin, Type IV TA system/AAA domain